MMSELTGKQIVMNRVRPFYGRILVVDSPVDQEELESGLIVPVQMEDSELKRAVVMHHDGDWNGAESYVYPELIPPGTVVWYVRGKKIGDVTIIDVDDIWAREA